MLTLGDQNSPLPGLHPTQICTRKVPPHRGEGISWQTTCTLDRYASEAEFLASKLNISNVVNSVEVQTENCKTDVERIVSLIYHLDCPVLCT